MIQRDDASQRQVDAARPDRSTWLSANAGSGKTRVLTDRVARLLLDDVDPQHILCLTYTKAAASEMQNRLFNRLGGWAMLPDDALRAELEKLGVERDLGPETLRKARRLFACAIETPGGLKIQTIHSFCSSLLRRFPLEAGVTPQFTEMDDRTASLLRAEIVEEIAEGPEAGVLYALARHYTGDDLDKLTAEIVRHGTALQAPVSDAKLAQVFAVPADLSETSLLSDVFLGSEQALLDQLIPALEASSSNDQKAAKSLREITQFDLSALAELEGLFLFKSGAKAFTAKIGSFPTKPCRENLTPIMPQIEDWMARVESARDRRLALGAMRKTRALHDFAAIFLKAYEKAKLRRGLLDFDDLILRTRDLLTNPDVAAWVLYRLDGGIDHILVDEAQDTSPVQWQVIERLAQEFTSGEGARADVPRTIFVVGDKKQSIYSFQGADPREFDRMKDEFANRLKSTNTPLSVLGMEYSFRSSNAVLSLVDQTFANAEQSGFAPDQGHKSFKSDMPGRVDLWPVIEKPDKEDQPEWYLPVDTKAPNDPAILLARKIARTIRQMIDDNTPIPDGKGGMAPAQPGDFLILVQRRSALFHEIIRECKDQNLPIAGADRLKVGAEMAVRDLGALLSYLSTPEDSLALATALRSPLFGWSEAQLYNLAHGRAQKYLSAELRDRAAEFPETTAILDDLRKQADYLRPYDLLQRILTRHDGRRKLLARLGVEAEDGIDALLSQAMAYEQRAVDSLTGFLVWLETDDLEIKRQMDSAGNRIRVMTVHGAKGLEAPIVILPDTGQRKNDIKDQILDHKGTALWKTGADDAPQVIREVVERAKAAQIAERDRLLYVAITRAEKWLIVAAAGDLGKTGDTWHDKVRTALEATGAAPHPTEGDGALRLEHGDWAMRPTHEAAGKTPDGPPALPGYFNKPAPGGAAALDTLKPSELGGAKALPGEGLEEEAAKRRGRQIHLLLEILPTVAPDSWPDTAARILANGPDAAEGAELDALLSEAQGVLTKPDLAHLFAPDVLAEVPISANIEALQNRRIHGIIDALIVTPDRVLAVDFKTNTVVPDSPETCPDGLLRQMGAYAHALAAIYPGRDIQTALLWTRNAALMPLPHDLVTKALRDTTIA
ncbi:double-strand break repair helicase AddA [Roseovarius sp. A21]|uniref:DNA 3'-5' helicase n=1 Tax=Roseovarius bejariae TaxID=2576383 RepID=A0A844D0V7_9RHOB|nr:double-strand break repair helicase AddA [Roseovarius bejariae]MRU15503.1 double-strand break repair helicase AddA [Roseovarius bejariae]